MHLCGKLLLVPTIISVASILMSTILDILNYIVFKKGISTTSISARKNMSGAILGIKASIIKAFLEIKFLPTKAYIYINSIIKTIYRMKVSKQNLLEWQTAEEAELNSRCDLKSHYKYMLPNIIVGTLFVIWTSINRI